MKILLSSVKEQSRDFVLTGPVRLKELEDAGRAEPGEARLEVRVDPAGERWYVSAEVEASFPFRCDRCGRPFAGALTGSFQLLVLATSPGDLEPDDEDTVVVLPPGSQELDLTAAAMEALWLDLPIQLSCEDGDAGPCPGPDGPEEAAAGEGEAAMDPRWGPLAALKQRLEAQAPKGPAATAADQNDSEEQE